MADYHGEGYLKKKRGGKRTKKNRVGLPHWVPDNGRLEAQMTAAYEPKNILITGGAGFIASHVAEHLFFKYPKYKTLDKDSEFCVERVEFW